MKRLIMIFALALAAFFPAANAQNGLTLRTVTLDAGHGGNDPGCISADGKTKEKDIALDVVKRLNRMLKEYYSDLNVVLTRDKDVFVPLEDRAKISNAANSDLFISVHVNAATSSRAHGFSIHCLGQSQRGNDLFGGNLELVRRENSVILLEEDHEARYEGFNPDDPESYIFFSLIQNAHLGHSLQFADDVARSMAERSPIRNNRGISQDPFWVLWRTASPAVLIEIGFMSNPADLEKLRDEAGREQIAACIFKAFKDFKQRFDNSSTVPVTSPVVEAPAPAEGGVLYGTQVLATGRKMSSQDPFFDGYVPVEIKGATLYKYIIGTSGNLQEARRLYQEIIKKFPDSYMVKIEDGKTSRIN